MFRRLGFITALLAAFLTNAEAQPTAATLESPTLDLSRYAQVAVAPTWTSIYLGTVSMKMPTFQRAGSTYTAAYTATVFPFFFYNEAGTLSVDVSEAQLDQLAHGKPIEFTGQATRSDGARRHVTGKATPKDATHGALKVRVAVSKEIELIFNTTYAFEARASVGQAAAQ